MKDRPRCLVGADLQGPPQTQRRDPVFAGSEVPTDRKRYGTLLKEGGDQMNAGRPAATDRHGASRAVAERCATSLRRPTELDLGQLPRRLLHAAGPEMR